MQPTPDGLIYRPGLFVEAIEKGRWLVIDELNRSNFDRAFGQLFTVLSGQAVVLPYVRPNENRPLVLVPEGAEVPIADPDALTIPQSWRIIATMNVFDKTAESIQTQADKLSARDTIAVSEGEDLDRQLSAISKKSEVDDALEALKAPLGEGGTTATTSAPKEKEKISSAFEEK